MILSRTCVGLGILLLCLTCVTAYYNLSYNEITWKDCVNNYINQHVVTKLEVVNKEWVRVYVQPGSSVDQYATPWFTIGTLSFFENNLKDAQENLKVEPANFIPLVYKDQFNIESFATYLEYLTIFMFITFVTLLLFKIKMDPHVIDFVDPKDNNVRFEDVAGCVEAKMEIMDFVNFLKNPQRYVNLGAKMPKGALLTGPPGTGKTLLAKALAAEANVPFLSTCGSKFTDKFYSTGATRVRDMFTMARKHTPCILFIDEIDTIGRTRDNNHNFQHVDSSLNQLLVEMDGFEVNSNIIVLAATNLEKHLDKALTRPGRFDRKINISKPDIKGRASIFDVHLQPLKTNLHKVDTAKILAARTPGFTGADIANVCNEAALIAVRYLDKSITMEHFERAIERVITGMEKKNSDLQANEKQIIAYYEAGRAVCGWFLQYAEPLIKISIIPCSKGIPGTQFLQTEKNMYSKRQLFDEMCVALGGRATERFFFKENTTRAQDDLKKVTNIAYAQVAHFGMNDEIGHMSYKLYQEGKMTTERPYSEFIANSIDSEVRKLVAKAYDDTMQLVKKHKEDIMKVAQWLFQQGVLSKEDMIKILGPRPFIEKSTYEDFIEGPMYENTSPTGPINCDIDGDPQIQNKNISEDVNI